MYRPVILIALALLWFGAYALLSQCIATPGLSAILRRPLPLVSALLAAATAILGLVKSTHLLALAFASWFGVTAVFLFFILDRVTDEHIQWGANWIVLLGIALIIIIVQASGGLARFLEGLHNHVNTLTASHIDISRVCFVGAIGALFIAFAIIDTPLIAKCIVLSRRWPIREHLRWNVLPNLHVWLLACIAGAIVAMPAPHIAGPRSHAFYDISLLTWCLFWLPVALTPPQILFLHSFDERNYRARRILSAFLPGNLVSLFPGATTGAGWVMCALRSIIGQGCRVASSHSWQSMVHVFMNRSEVILMDLSFPRAGLLTELQYLSSDKKLVDKTTFIGKTEMEVRCTLNKLVHGSCASHAQCLLLRPCIGLDEIWQPTSLSFFLLSLNAIANANIKLNVIRGMYPARRFLLYLAIVFIITVFVGAHTYTS